MEGAYSLAHPMAENSPSYRGIKPLLAWEEVLADSILRYLLIGDIHRGLLNRYGPGTEIIFFSSSETQEAFSTLQRRDRVRPFESRFYPSEGERADGTRTSRPP